MTDIPRRDFLTKTGAAVAGLAVLSSVAAVQQAHAASGRTMKRYVIERDVPGIGLKTPEEMSEAAAASNAAIAQLVPGIQWEHSYRTADKTFCIYLAEDEAVILKHSELSGFPANKITLVESIVDPTTAV